MKKTIVLLTIVLAIVAAPVFAEVTASGKADFRFAYTGDEYAEGNDNDLKVTYGATLSDFTSISVTAEASNQTTKDKNGLTLNEMTLTQDVTGALGVDAGVGVALTFGVASFEPKEYQAVAGYGDFEYGDSMPDFAGITDEASALAALSNASSYHILDPGTIMTKASFSVSDMVTVDAAIYEPSGKDLAIGEVGSDMMQFGVNAYGTFGMVDASVSFLKIADETTSIAANGAASPIDGLTVGAGMTMMMFDFMGDSENAGKYGVSAAYTMDALTAGVAMVSSFSSIDTDQDFVDVTSLAFNAKYMVNDATKVFAGVKMVDLTGDEDLAYEVGASYTLDAVTYSVGYADDSDMVNKITGVNEDGHAFLRVQASF